MEVTLATAVRKMLSSEIRRGATDTGTSIQDDGSLETVALLS